MANSAQAIKRVRQAQSSCLANKQIMTRIRTYHKKALHAVSEKNVKLAAEQFKLFVVFASRAVKSNLLTQNKVARLTSRLNAKIKESSQKK